MQLLQRRPVPQLHDHRSREAVAVHVTEAVRDRSEARLQGVGKALRRVPVDDTGDARGPGRGGFGLRPAQPDDAGRFGEVRSRADEGERALSGPEGAAHHPQLRVALHPACAERSGDVAGQRQQLAQVSPCETEPPAGHGREASTVPTDRTEGERR